MKKRRVALVLGCLGLNVVGLLLVLAYARPSAATAPPGRAADAGKGEEAPPKMATSRITHVTVYPDSALVTREVEVPAGGGLRELIISPLPEATIISSLYTESSDGIRVLTTRFRTRPVKEDTREEVRKIDEEIRKLQQDARRLQSEMK